MDTACCKSEACLVYPRHDRRVESLKNVKIRFESMCMPPNATTLVQINEAHAGGVQDPVLYCNKCSKALHHKRVFITNFKEINPNCKLCIHDIVGTNHRLYYRREGVYDPRMPWSYCDTTRRAFNALHSAMTFYAYGNEDGAYGKIIGCLEYTPMECHCPLSRVIIRNAWVCHNCVGSEDFALNVAPVLSDLKKQANLLMPNKYERRWFELNSQVNLLESLYMPNDTEDYRHEQGTEEKDYSALRTSKRKRDESDSDRSGDWRTISAGLDQPVLTRARTDYAIRKRPRGTVASDSIPIFELSDEEFGGYQGFKYPRY